MREGEFEILIHRRLLVDDDRGVEEPLNETDADKQGLRQTFRHQIVFGNNYRNVQKRNDQRILPTIDSTRIYGIITLIKQIFKGQQQKYPYFSTSFSQTLSETLRGW